VCGVTAVCRARTPGRDVYTVHVLDFVVCTRLKLLPPSPPPPTSTARDRNRKRPHKTSPCPHSDHDLLEYTPWVHVNVMRRWPLPPRRESAIGVFFKHACSKIPAQPSHAATSAFRQSNIFETVTSPSRRHPTCSCRTPGHARWARPANRWAQNWHRRPSLSAWAHRAAASRRSAGRQSQSHETKYAP